jgi:hypothetical protein
LFCLMRLIWDLMFATEQCLFDDSGGGSVGTLVGCLSEQVKRPGERAEDATHKVTSGAQRRPNRARCPRVRGSSP